LPSRVLFVEEILVDEWEERMDGSKVNVKEDILTLPWREDVNAYCI
jgi:hypothetical protein